MSMFQSSVFSFIHLFIGAYTSTISVSLEVTQRKSSNFPFFEDYMPRSGVGKLCPLHPHPNLAYCLFLYVLLSDLLLFDIGTKPRLPPAVPLLSPCCPLAVPVPLSPVGRFCTKCWTLLTWEWMTPSSLASCSS